jgi:hypothetical protein
MVDAGGNEENNPSSSNKATLIRREDLADATREKKSA